MTGDPAISLALSAHLSYLQAHPPMSHRGITELMWTKWVLREYVVCSDSKLDPGQIAQQEACSNWTASYWGSTCSWTSMTNCLQEMLVMRTTQSAHNMPSWHTRIRVESREAKQMPDVPGLGRQGLVSNSWIICIGLQSDCMIDGWHSVRTDFAFG